MEIVANGLPNCSAVLVSASLVAVQYMSMQQVSSASRGVSEQPSAPGLTKAIPH